jgi:hypothetical protein
MAENKNVEVVFVRLNTLVMNKKAQEIYSTPKNYELIRQSIVDNGIIQPLLINEEDNMIISGNLRYSIAKKFKMNYVPVIKVQLGENQNINDLLILSNTQREKSLLDKYHENEYINGLFSFGQGARMDLRPDQQKEKELKEEMRSVLSAAEIEYFARINSIAKKKHGAENYRQVIIQGLKKIDEGDITRNAFKLSLEGAKSTQKDQNKKKGKTIVTTTLNKEMAMVEIQKILKRVAEDLHEEILLHFLSKQIYDMAS